MEKSLVSIIMGSDSDLLIMQEAAKVCEEFQVPFEMTIVSAHRTPDLFIEYAHSVEERGIKIIIAGAGGAAHLPGMVAAMTILPVIGVPIKGKSLEGIDSLLSIVQMPPGIPVATVGINGAKNAGLLAIRILAATDKNMGDALRSFTRSMGNEVKNKAEKLEKIGYKNYRAQP